MEDWHRWRAAGGLFVDVLVDGGRKRESGGSGERQSGVVKSLQSAQLHLQCRVTGSYTHVQ